MEIYVEPWKVNWTDRLQIRDFWNESVQPQATCIFSRWELDCSSTRIQFFVESLGFLLEMVENEKVKQVDANFVNRLAPGVMIYLRIFAKISEMGSFYNYIGVE